MPASEAEYTNNNFNALKPSGTAVAIRGAKPGRTPDDKAFLYLDGFLKFLAPVGGGHVEGYIGYCKAGSAKLAYHAGPRHFGTQAHLNGDLILFNDAGLNTLGHTNIPLVFSRKANNIKIDTLLRSSYFDGSTEYGFLYKATTETIWREWVYTSPIGATVETTLRLVLSTTYAKFTYLQVKPYIKNPEGTFIGGEVVIYLEDAVFEYSVEKRPTTCEAGGPVIIYITKTVQDNLANVTTTSTRNGWFAYKDENLSIGADDGLYHGLEAEGKVFSLSLAGEITHYTTCATPPPPVTYQLILSLSIDTNNKIIVTAELSQTYTASVTITGRVQSYLNGEATKIGKEFSITIAAGQTAGALNTLISYLNTETYEIINVNSAGLTYQTAGL